MKLFIVPRMTFKGHSKPWAMSFFIRSPGFSVRGRKCRLGTYVHLFMTTIEVIKKNDNNSCSDIEGRTMCHLRWHSSMGHILLCISGLYIHTYII